MLIIGHRGAMGYAPENTLASFKKALELKVDMIELDVYVCKSGELVVIHDDKVNRTTNGRGYVIEKTLADLKKLDAGQGEKIPTLNGVLDLINKKVKVNIELKGPNTAGPAHKLITEYINNKGWHEDHFLLSSFNHMELMAFHTLSPKIKIGILITDIFPALVELAEKMVAYSINAPTKCITREFVDDAHGRGLRVYVWTVNKASDIRRMKDLGVDGIFSNFPDRLDQI